MAWWTCTCNSCENHAPHFYGNWACDPVAGRRGWTMLNFCVLVAATTSDTRRQHRDSTATGRWAVVGPWSLRFWYCESPLRHVDFIQDSWMSLIWTCGVNYLALPTVGYPTCSDNWRPDKWHSTFSLLVVCFCLLMSWLPSKMSEPARRLETARKSEVDRQTK